MKNDEKSFLKFELKKYMKRKKILINKIKSSQQLK